MRKMIIGLAAIAVLVPAAAQAMSVAEWLAKADALKAKGVFAVGSPDIALLGDEVKAAGAAYRAGLAKQIAAGKKPSSCPPPVGTAKITSDDIIKDFKAIPVARQKQSVAQAWAAMMTRRYPCKA